MRDIAVNIRQAEVTARVAVCQFFVINPHLMQNRRMQIMNAHAFINGLDAQIICGSIGHSTTNTASRQPHAEPRRVVIASFVTLCCGSSSEFSPPDYQRLIKQSARLEVANQCGNWLIAL